MHSVGAICHVEASTQCYELILRILGLIREIKGLIETHFSFIVPSFFYTLYHFTMETDIHSVLGSSHSKGR